MGHWSEKIMQNEGFVVVPVEPPGCFLIVGDPPIYLVPENHPLMVKFKAEYGDPMFRCIQEGKVHYTMGEDEFAGCKESINK